MEALEDKSLKSAKKRFLASIIMVVLAIVYLIWPVDFIPDFLVPVGMLDDIPLLLATAIYSGYSFWKLKKERQKQEAVNETDENMG